jgi:hypothetical protein
MKKISFIIMFILSYTSIHAQVQKGTRAYLEEKRGFKIFTLVTPINDVLQYIEYKEDSKAEKIYTVIDSTLLKAGTIKLQSINIYSYNDTISKIAIVVDQYNKRLLKEAFEELYGKDTYQPMKHKDYCIWMSENTELSFNSEFNVNEGLVVMLDYPLLRAIKAANERINSSNADEL